MKAVYERNWIVCGGSSAVEWDEDVAAIASRSAWVDGGHKDQDPIAVDELEYCTTDAQNMDPVCY